MYGLVNKAIQDMVCSGYSEQIWKQIKHKAEVNVDVFLSMESYPDDITHRLVKAASVILSLSSAEIMQAFGEFWVQYTAQEGYGEMMDMSGDTLPEFLENLDNLHARVGVSFPKLQPPSFECTDMEENSLNLHYRSSREGLSPMILGLVKGLGARFDTKVEITQTQTRDEDAECDEFLVIYKPN
ncbi:MULTISPECIES: heme NO-binding domain-containing protein [Nostoc]|uniref:Heme NO-binding domain-containing protein n=1 Tax=Nostoc flagelliforme FACHB-838 TaxID=2692904 RepID=A0ABR8E1E7_9NOSO|nr:MULTISPECIES: heme NO-binding domain-containing protein [Nostoc]MBD2249648.1 heme NO-binding domain-containing protein [Nostoc sp. FACHB-888]MBD2535552.1 heme NO-binding domain-containing protein [Nostoc flagelliforme FACHB-838]